MKIYHTASERSNTRYLDCLIINAEYVSTVQRPNKDHVSHRLYQISRKNFRTAPYFIMHAVLINYAFDSLSLNTIDNSLGNWIYTSLITTYCINKSGFFSQRFFPRCFSLSLSPFSPLSLPHFSGGHFLLSILPPSPLSGYFFFFFYVTCRIRTLNSLSSSSDQQSILYTLVLHVLVANNG